MTHFGVLLGLAYNQFVDELHEHLAKHGFTHLKPTFGFAFKVLAQESVTTSRLAALLRITPQGAAKTVEEMVAAGYVDRVPDPSDGRVKLLVLTDRARALLATGHEFHQAFERELAQSLGEAKIETFREVLDAMVARSDSPDSLARTLKQL
ncbi:MarR family winged helix-turn-helix transcriptional regulator [Nonomuraea sediminis]|uniref:MarR family winged helix-turn-helix transcriptional regulator n=1 Tax=Nonomuraea sediminis TaxID=2835864 RepID=UPI001BDC8001|nr:MarR family winged helix-turn-helix transcriptional regulator [Nonomuraea sediminis]